MFDSIKDNSGLSDEFERLFKSIGALYGKNNLAKAKSETERYLKMRDNFAGIKIPVPPAGKLLKWNPSDSYLTRSSNPVPIDDNHTAFMNMQTKLKLYDTSRLYGCI